MSRTRHKLKESRKTGAKRYSAHCKNNGTCTYCISNRTHKHKRSPAMDEEAIQIEIDNEEYLFEIDEDDGEELEDES